MDIDVKPLDVKRDERGWLAEILRPEDVKVKGFGQFFVSVANPGKVKGNHYHKRKVEWFSVVSGELEIHLLDMKTKEKKIVPLGDNHQSLLRIGPGVAHAVRCVSKGPAVLLSYISESYDAKDPDTFQESVL